MKNHAILLSIKPEFVALIEAGSKKYEFRRKTPNVKTGDLALVYESSPTKSLVGVFKIGKVVSESPKFLWEALGGQSGLNQKPFFEYFEGTDSGCALEIVEYWPLSERVCINTMRSRANIEPPQSYRFLSKAQVGKMIEGSLV